MPVCLPLVFRRLGLLILGLAAAALAGAAQGEDRPDLQLSELKNVRLAFFSSLGPERLGHLRFAEVGGAQLKLGPFQIATPGVAIREARLEINDTACTAADWTAFTGSLAKYRAAQLPQPLVVRLPDGRECLSPRFPAVKGLLLVFERAQLRAPGAALSAPQAVVVGWEGNRARVLQPTGFSPAPVLPASAEVSAPAPSLSNRPSASP